jgi:hypothetical protein
MERHPCLPAEDLAQPPGVTCCACQPERLGEVWPSHLWVVAVYEAAGGERPDQQGEVAEFAGDRQGFFGLIGAVRGAGPRVEQRRIRECLRTHSPRYHGGLGSLVGEDGVEPGQPFSGPAPCEPQWLQRRRELQRKLGV